MTDASVLEADPRAQAPAVDVRPGDVLDGRYRLEELVGRGGMGAVFRATDTVLERTVAIKLFAAAAVDERDRERRASETRLLASLSHPSLVTLYDSRTAKDGSGYMVLEYVDGGTLSDRIARGALAPAEVAEIAAELGDALDAVHGAGVIHRDVKPANVLMHAAPSLVRVSLADFGIAYLVDAARLTTPGMAVGTAAYFSPEQARGAEPSPASDIYALGLVLIEALTGRRAFPQTTPIEAAVARLHTAPEVPGGFGYGWRSLLTAMTATDPAERPTARQVAERARALTGADADPGATAAALPAAADVTAPVKLDDGPATQADAPVVAPAPRIADEAELTRVLPVASASRRGRRRASRRRPGALGVTGLAAVGALVLGIGAWGATAALPAESPTVGARQVETRVDEARVAPSEAPAEQPAQGPAAEPAVAETASRPAAPAEAEPAPQQKASTTPSGEGPAVPAHAASEGKTRGNGNGNGEPAVGTSGKGRDGD
ncbi:serine/threonine-protein kinase [Microbacterium lacusdiani]